MVLRAEVVVYWAIDVGVWLHLFCGLCLLYCVSCVFYVCMVEVLYWLLFT